MLQARYEASHPGIRVERRTKPWKVKFRSGFNYDVIIDYENDSMVSIGSMCHKCEHCNAFKWKDQTKGMCCDGGKVKLSPIQPPPEPLKELLLGDHPDHVHFMQYIRKYYGCFQMISFGAHRVVESGFMPTFKVQGQVYHLIGSLLPPEETQPKFLQIYFVGEDETETQLRCQTNLM